MKQEPIQGPGIQWAIGQLMENYFKLPAKRKPKAVKTDPERGEPARCYTCKTDSYFDDKGCSTCGGSGDLPELQSVDMTVYRDFDEVPVQVSFKNGVMLDAWVVADVGGSSTRPPRWAQGNDITLSLEEQAEAIRALKSLDN